LGITKQLKDTAELFVEDKLQENFKDKLTRYRDLLSAGKRAVFIGVCRGKLSEGIDFSDEAARCVIMIGVPFPQKTEPNVLMKLHFIDSCRG
jgi:regulator of telomere elongation helicase 1